MARAEGDGHTAAARESTTTSDVGLFFSLFFFRARVGAELAVLRVEVEIEANWEEGAVRNTRSDGIEGSKEIGEVEEIQGIKEMGPCDPRKRRRAAQSE